MSRRKSTHRAHCAEAECREFAFWEFDRVSDMRDHMRRLAREPWKCLRHTDPEKTLSATNVVREVAFVATPGDGVIADHLFWHDGRSLGSGFAFGPGFRAHAGDFPAGTRLVVTARIELPKGNS